MTTYAATVEAQLSPGVTSRAPHGSKGARTAPVRGNDDMTPCGVPGRICGTQVSMHVATNGIGFTHRPPRWNLPNL